MAQWAEDPHLIFSLLKIVSPDTDIEITIDICIYIYISISISLALLEWAPWRAPKIRAFLASVARILEKAQKILLWSTSPTHQFSCHGVLQLLNIDTSLLTGSLPQDKQLDLYTNFNTVDKKCMLLNCNFLINCCGLNLQYKCNVSAYLGLCIHTHIYIYICIYANAAGQLCRFD